MSRKCLMPFIVMIGFILFGCFFMHGSDGGGETSFRLPRMVNPADIALPQGYRIEPIASGLTFPTGITFDDAGRPYVVESGYAHGEVWTVPRLLRIEADGKTTVIAEGRRNGPWTGVTFNQGSFYVAEGGEMEGGRILKISSDGAIVPLIETLPSRGDHHTNGPLSGPEEWIYFSIGTYTNSGVVGEDNAKFGWLKRFPNLHDIPCQDIELTGRNFTTKNAVEPESGGEAITGAFSPFGKPTEKGQVIPGNIPCNGSILRIRPDGGSPELVAWGFRNPFGMAFSPDGRLFVTENQYDVRGSRPVFGAGDLLWEVTPGAWYGWPDFHGNTPLNDGNRYKPQGKSVPTPLLSKYPQTPPKPVAILAVHSSSDGFDFSRNAEFGHAGQAFIAQFGDESPATGKTLHPVGFKVVRVDVTTGIVTEFAVNWGKTNGPASWLRSGGLERPVATRFDPSGRALYVVDFGVMLNTKKGANPIKETGVVWKITKR